MFLLNIHACLKMRFDIFFSWFFSLRNPGNANGFNGIPSTTYRSGKFVPLLRAEFWERIFIIENRQRQRQRGRS